MISNNYLVALWRRNALLHYNWPKYRPRFLSQTILWYSRANDWNLAQSYLQRFPISTLPPWSRQSNHQASTSLGRLPISRSIHIIQLGRNIRRFCVSLCIDICPTIVLSLIVDSCFLAPAFNLLHSWITMMWYHISRYIDPGPSNETIYWLDGP